MDDKTRLVEPRPLTHADTRLVIAGTLLPVFIGSLDNTVLASALPSIGRDLNDIRSPPWLITAYLIAATAAMPLFGKVSDIMAAASRCSRRSRLYRWLAHLRARTEYAHAHPRAAVQGLGGGGLTSMGMVVLGDIAAPKDRGSTTRTSR